MIDEVKVISEFVRDNKKPLSDYLRKKIIDAGAKQYVAQLGKQGIQEMENEAAGVLLDIACAFVNRLNSMANLTAESIWPHLPLDLKESVRLPRSAAYYEALERSKKLNGPHP